MLDVCTTTASSAICDLVLRAVPSSTRILAGQSVAHVPIICPSFANVRSIPYPSEGSMSQSCSALRRFDSRLPPVFVTLRLRLMDIGSCSESSSSSLGTSACFFFTLFLVLRFPPFAFFTFSFCAADGVWFFFR
jgi:hypothetical protein